MANGRKSIQQIEANQLALKELVECGSPLIMRADDSSKLAFRRKFPLPEIGFRSGKVTVTGYVRGTNSRISALILRCECGEPEYTVKLNNFKEFRITRCRICAQRSVGSSRKSYWAYSDILPDDDHRERLLNRLSSAITRCHSPNSSQYKHYGARGITVFEGWRNDRASFLRYAITLEGWDDPNLQIDRIDVNRGYEPDNIRFISAKENVKNRRRIADLEAKILKLKSLLGSSD